MFKKILSLCVIAAALHLIIAPNSVQAFKPTNGLGHDRLTRTALRAIGFCRAQIEDIVDNNIGVDHGYEFFKSEAHCDNDLVNECHDRIVSFAADAITKAQAVVNNRPILPFNGAIDMSGPNEEMGRALHTLQDFYSHSNKINIEPGVHSTFGDITVKQLDQSLIVQEDDQACQDDHATLVPGLTKITTGYFEPDVCPDPRGKCNHGNDLVVTCDGINKDDPSRPNYTPAYAAAYSATIKFATQILNALPEGTQTALKGGDRCGRELAFVIDVGSDQLENIKNVIRDYVPQIDFLSRTFLIPFAVQDCSAINSSVTEYTDQKEFFDALDNLLPVTGGPAADDSNTTTCGKPMMCAISSGLSRMVNTAQSSMFVFIDGDSSDSYRVHDIANQANAAAVPITILQGQTCETISTSSHARRKPKLSSTTIASTLSNKYPLKKKLISLQQTSTDANVTNITSTAAMELLVLSTGGARRLGSFDDENTVLRFMSAPLEQLVPVVLYASQAIITEEGACADYPITVDEEVLFNVTVFASYSYAFNSSAVNLFDPSGQLLEANHTDSDPNSSRTSFGLKYWNLGSTPQLGTWMFQICAINSTTSGSVNAVYDFNLTATGRSEYFIADLQFGDTVNNVSSSREFDIMTVQGNLVQGRVYTYFGADLKGNASFVRSISAMFVDTRNGSVLLSDPFDLTISVPDPEGLNSRVTLAEGTTVPAIPEFPFFVRFNITLDSSQGANLFDLPRFDTIYREPVRVAVAYQSINPFETIEPAEIQELVFWVNNTDQTNAINATLRFAVIPSDGIVVLLTNSSSSNNGTNDDDNENRITDYIVLQPAENRQVSIQVKANDPGYNKSSTVLFRVDDQGDKTNFNYASVRMTVLTNGTDSSSAFGLNGFAAAASWNALFMMLVSMFALMNLGL